MGVAIKDMIGQFHRAKSAERMWHLRVQEVSKFVQAAEDEMAVSQL